MGAPRGHHPPLPRPPGLTVPGDRQISWAQLSAPVGVNKLSLPDEDVALAATGCARGTITPLGSTTAWPVFADERLRGTGSRWVRANMAHVAFADADARITAHDATVADITDPLGRRAEPRE